MAKEAVFTMKLEPELRAEFMAEAEAAHRPEKGPERGCRSGPGAADVR